VIGLLLFFECCSFALNVLPICSWRVRNGRLLPDEANWQFAIAFKRTRLLGLHGEQALIEVERLLQKMREAPRPGLLQRASGQPG
jgi:hypothetical protein